MQSPIDAILVDLVDFMTGGGALPWRPEGKFLRPADGLRDQLIAELRQLVSHDAQAALSELSAAMRRLTDDPGAAGDRILALRMAEFRLRHHVEELSIYELAEADLRLLHSSSALACSLAHQASFASDVLDAYLDQVARGVA